MKISLGNTPEKISGNNTKLYIDDHEALYWVEQGSVDIYMQTENGQWHHWFRVKSSEGFAAANLKAEFPFRLLVRLNDEALIVKLNMKSIHQKVPNDVPLLAQLLDQFLENIANTVRHDLPPTDVVDVSDLKLITIKKRRAITVLEKVRWFKLRSGPTFFNGDSGYGYNQPQTWCPLMKGNWYWIANQETFELYSTESILQHPFSEVVEPFMGMIATLFWNHLQKEALYNEMMVYESQGDQQQQMIESCENLINAFRGSAKVRYIMRSNLPIYQTLSAIADEEKVFIRVPQGTQLIDDADAKIKAILSYSKLFYRCVTLSLDWDSHHQGPFLAFTAADHYPVAVLPKGYKSYWIVDNREKNPIEITPRTKSLLGLSAYAIIKPFDKLQLTIRDLLVFAVQGTRLDFTIFILLGLMSAFLGLLTPIITQYIFDDVIMTHNTFQLYQIMAILMGLTVPIALFEFVKRIALLNIETIADNQIEMGFWDRIFKLPAYFFRKTNAGEIMSRVGNLIDIRSQLSGTTLLFVMDLIFIVTDVGLIFYYQFELAIILLAILAVLSYIYVVVSKRIIVIENKLVAYTATNYGILTEILSAISKIRTAGRESAAFNYWTRSFSKLQITAVKSQRFHIMMNTFLGVLPLVILGIMYALIANMLTKDNAFTTGTFLAFNMAFGQILGVMFGFFDEVSKLISLVPLFQQTKRFIDTPPEVSPDAKEPGELHGEIELSHVSFQYEGADGLVVKDVSINIAAGEYVAIVGPSGSGKSTLIRLLLGFEKPNHGRIYLDNKDTDYLDMELVRRQMGVVLQNDQLLTGTILSNVCALKKLPIAEVKTLLETVGILEDVEKMPMKLHTMINNEMEGISGGQKERILIARVLARNPSILILDEAMRALDNYHQHKIIQNLKTLKMTRIIIAHRLSTLTQVDKIIVMKDGQVVEMGTFDQLIEKKAAFYELCYQQGLNDSA